MSTDRYNFATELMIQVVCFYIGVALFIGLCMVPPLIIMLPYALPLTFMVCIIVNISFIIRFVKGTSKEIEEVIQPILEGNYDIVFGSRFLEKKSDIPAFKKKIIFPLAKLVNRVFLGIKTSDPQSGFRAMTREVAERIQIEQDGKAHCSEIMAKAFEYKLKIKEVPITVIYHEFGQSMGHGFKILKDILFSKISK